MPKSIVIVTRGSALALAQANMVRAQCLKLFPDREFQIKILKTTGDKLQTASLASAELPKGLFTKELEMALLANEGDLAVHSLKDLPTELPEGLILGGVSKRADPRDVLIYRGPSNGNDDAKQGRTFPAHLKLDELPREAVVATSSTRRSAQVQEKRPDLTIVPIRGNVGTRLKKLADNPQLDAIILAAAGLERLNFEFLSNGSLVSRTNSNDPQTSVPLGLLATRLDPSEMLPCVGQAALGFEIRQNDPEMQSVCERLNDPETLSCVLAERAFLRAVGGGCQIPVGALAEMQNGKLRMRVVSFLGDSVRHSNGEGSKAEAEYLGRKLASEVSGS
jgi:hydroxymethylbilane synthase